MSEHSLSNQAESERAESEQSGSEQSVSEQSAPEQSVSEQAIPEQSDSEHPGCLSERKDTVSQAIDAAQQGLHAIEQNLAEVDGELGEMAQQRSQYHLLQQAVDALESLQEQGAAVMFWGETLGEQAGIAHLNGLAKRIHVFEDQLRELEQRRVEVLRTMRRQQDQIDVLAEDLYDIEQEEESRQQEWVIEREQSELPKVLQIMPWMRGFEEDQRFRKILAGTLAACLLLGMLLPLIDIPIPERDEEIEVPERFVQLIQKQQKKPLPPPRPEPEQPLTEPEPEKEPEKKVVQEKPPETPKKVAQQAKPEVRKQKSVRERVATRGILAFRESFSNLASSRPSAKLGAKARINDAGKAATGRPERNMVATQATGSSGGINLSSLSRDAGGGGGGSSEMAGVVTTQVESTLAGPGGSDRPLSAGAAAGRTDEEIQIVFDRYKAALYRLYNRELRKDPTLRGQMVLKLTIEPDGSVSLCSLQSSDMNAPALADQVVSRVGRFNFGAKDVPAVTIVYPIDFLPAA